MVIRSRSRKSGDKWSTGACRLWLACEERGWTQFEISTRLKVSRGQVSRWFAGDTRPGRLYATKLKRLLGIDPLAFDELLPPVRLPYRAPRNKAEAA